MTNIPKWIENYAEQLQEEFTDEVVFMGLSHNFSQGFETQNKIYNIVIIFKELSDRTLRRYDRFIQKQPERNVIEGFVAGKEDVLHWEPSELFKLFYDTKSILGDLDFLVPLFDPETIARSIRISLGDLYRLTTENILYVKQNDDVEELYNLAVFIIKIIYLQSNETYTDDLETLMELVGDDRNRDIIKTAINLNEGENLNYELISERVFLWAQRQLRELNMKKVADAVIEEDEQVPHS